MIDVSNEILNNIKTRRSIRKYKDTQITKEELNLILEAATYAPSGGNSQTWLFTAIRNKKVLETLRQLAQEQIAKWDFPNDAYRGKINAQKGAQNGNHHFFYHAPTLIIVSNVNYANTMADCALALQNIF